ncbi:MAG: aldehyde dehydrogenase family protein, partial [Microbacteriaceae bacterium]
MTPSTLLIDGAWVEALSGEREDVTSPFDGHVVGSVALGRTADAIRAVDAAVAGFEKWRRTPAHERAAILVKAADLADERAEEIAQIIAGEN